jgi:His/Glu/Gln/Arg/opine family amino acid ABC transporter permease subunit
MGLDFQSIIDFLPLFIRGVQTTLLLATLTLLFGLALGIPIAFIRLGKNKIIAYLLKIYVDIIRGTPLLLQLYIFAYAIPLTFSGISLTPFQAGIIALGLNSSAYVSEIIRSGIQAVDKGQLEGGLSLGLSELNVFFKVILPQAIKNVLPALGNELITIVKESSIVSIVGIVDIMRVADQIKAATFRVFEALIIAGALYYLITKTLAILVAKLEKRLATND